MSDEAVTRGHVDSPGSTSGSGFQRAEEADGGRFFFVDSLRGIAAMLVVVHHLFGPVRQYFDSLLPDVFIRILRLGYLGVDIFFVISGFVIAYSIRHGVFTLKYLFAFGIRRSIRLDPPYWITIGLQIGLLALGIRLFPDLGSKLPSSEQVLAHLVYLQNILGYGDIVDIFWTLCYEVQFYLVLVGSAVMFRLMTSAIGSMRITWFLASLFGVAAFAYSVLIHFGPLATPLPGLFIDRWFQFFLGVLAVSAALIPRLFRVFVTAWFVVAASCIVWYGKHSIDGAVALFISSLMYYAVTHGHMGTWLCNKPFQFLGKISYSLYLIHTVVGWRAVQLMKRIIGDDMGPLLASGVFMVGVVISVLAAWALYALFEAPSLRLCKRIRMPKNPNSRALWSLG